MNERHRQKQFPSPFSPEELELDPEKKLWVPGRKKILLPTVKPVSLWDFFDFSKIALEKLDISRNPLWDRHFREMHPECVPSRSEVIRVPVSDKPRTWNDVQRTTQPNFRSRYMRGW
jgi:hypothetical protein